jgi:hypothetical protein
MRIFDKSAVNEFIGEGLWLGEGFDRPPPLNGAKTMVNGGRENCLWPETTCNTDCPHGTYVGFLADIVVTRAKRSGDHRTIAFLARKSRQVEIMRRGFCRTDERSIPGHWRHHPVVNNRLIAQLGNFGHRLSFCVARLVCH